MSDEIERLLRQVTPPRAPGELRARVLAAVADQLRSSAAPRSRPRFRPGLAVAAGLLASISLNFWVDAELDRRLAVVLGPPPVRRQAAEIAADIASVAGPSTGQWAYDRLTFRRPQTGGLLQYVVQLELMIQELTVNDKETANEAREENPQMDRDRHSSRDHRPFAPQCLLRLEHRNTA